MSRTIEEILAAKQPQVQTAHVLLDPSLEEERTRLLKALGKAEAFDKLHNERDTAPAIRSQIEVVEKKIADTRIAFRFQSIGRKAWGALLDEWKPREDNPDDEEAGFNIDEFPPRLLALSAIEPKITLDQAYTIWSEWSDAEATVLLAAAMLANREVVDVPFTSDGIAMEALSTETGSAIPSTKGSHTPSS